MAKILVTGAAGFLGSHLINTLHAAGEDVIGLDDLSGGFIDNLDAGVPFVAGSTGDSALVARIFKANDIRIVYHLAAYAAEGLSHFIRRFNYENNVLDSMVLIDAAINAHVECFVFTSSMAVYGTQRPPFVESAPLHPEDPYGIAKMAVELDLKAACALFGLPYVIFRPHNLYGEHQNIADPYRNVVGIFMRQILDGVPMTVFGDGSQIRAFSYVGDILPILVRAPHVLEARQSTFNLGADEPYTINELARAVALVMDVPAWPIVHVPARYEVHEAFSNHDRLLTVFGERPVTPIMEALRRMAEWARHAPRRAAGPFHDLEVRQGLPAKWALLERR